MSNIQQSRTLNSNRRGIGPTSWVMLFMAVIISLAVVAPDSHAHDQFTKVYLTQDDNPSCMHLHWQTDTHLHGGWVEWGYTEDGLFYDEDANEEHQNIQNLYPLRSAEDFIRWDATICTTPGLRIYYKAYAAEEMDHDNNNAVYTVGGSFFLPLPPEAQHVVFWGYGDTRDTGSDFNEVSKGLWEAMRADPKGTNSTFLLHSGDVVYNGGKDEIDYSNHNWLHYFSKYSYAEYILKTVPVPMAIGNHDFTWDGEGVKQPKYFYTNFPYAQYADSIGMIPHLDDDGHLVSASPEDQAINDAYYSFDYGPVHVAVVNTYSADSGSGGCTLTDSLLPGHYQYEWLDQDLSASDKPWKIVLMHMAIKSCGCDDWADDVNNTTVRSDLRALFAEHGVKLVVAGHDHYFASNTKEGVVYLTLGGGGATDLEDDPPCKIGKFHYAKFRVHDEGTLGVAVYGWLPGETHLNKEKIYETTITRDAPVVTKASFEASSYYQDYQIPIRFTCTTPGVHRWYSRWNNTHYWYMNQSEPREANPVYTFPKPSNGIETHTVRMGVYDGEDVLYVTKDVTVFDPAYIDMTLGNQLNINDKAAVFIRPQNEPFDEEKHFRGFFSQGQGRVFKVAPGAYQVIVHAPGFDDWSYYIDIPAGKLFNIPCVLTRIWPETGIVIGSVPRGADVTVTTWDDQVITGTTPFHYANYCCPCSSIEKESSCNFNYVVDNEGRKVESTGDITTYCNSCVLVLDKTEMLYLDLRSSSEAEPESAAHNPLIIREPSDQRIVNEGNARLRVSARSQDPLTYRWYEGESGDTSNPIVGATEAVYFTPKAEEDKQYWVRVHARLDHHDSRTATVTVVPEGPVIKHTRPRIPHPGKHVRVFGGPFDPVELDEHHIYFDEFKARVTNIHDDKIDVIVPKGVAGRKTVSIHIKSFGVWSKALTQPVKDWQKP